MRAGKRSLDERTLKSTLGRLGTVVAAFLAVLSVASANAQATLPAGALGPAPEEFSDVESTHWAYPAVDALARIGIVTGYPGGDYRGEQSASRYEVALVAARLIDYTDQILGAVPGARFEERMRRDEVSLGRTSLLERTESLEAALNDAASLRYVRRLEGRLVALERALNVERGTDEFPAALEDGSQGERSAWSEARRNAQAGPRGGPVTQGGGVQLAQQPLYPFYIGVAPGVISTAGDLYLSVQAGYDNLVGPVGVASRLTFNGGDDELRLSLDALVRLDALTDDFDLYGGFGVGYTLRPTGNALLVEAPFGVEYFVTPRVGLFAQLITSYGFAPVSSIDAGLVAGINLRF